MRTNTGKILCNDCGKKIPKINGQYLMTTTTITSIPGQAETYCLNCYRMHYSPDELIELDAALTAGFRRHVLGIPTPQDVENLKRGPVEETLAENASHFKLQGRPWMKTERNHEYQCR